nr:MAG: replication initiator protein [Microviridae sp.]
MRILHELSSWNNKASFITLTYDDEHLPPNASLVKNDLQLFFKRLRKSLEPYKRKIKYFASGEYGSTTNRPHYHMIVFGLDLSKDDKQFIINAWHNCDWKNPHILQKSFGIAEPDSINYVSAYIHDKLSGEMAIEEYTNYGREPVFKISSLGIGKQFAFDNKQQIKDNKFITMFGTKMSIPRYYIKKLDIDVDTLKQFAIKKQTDVNEIYIKRKIPDSCIDYMLSNKERTKLSSDIDKAVKQHDLNLHAKISLKKRQKF